MLGSLVLHAKLLHVLSCSLELLLSAVLMLWQDLWPSMMTVAGFSSFYEENPLAVWAAVGATVVLAPLSTFLFGKTAKKNVPPFLSAADWKDITLMEKKSESPTVRRLTCAPACHAKAQLCLWSERLYALYLVAGIGLNLHFCSAACCAVAAQRCLQLSQDVC